MTLSITTFSILKLSIKAILGTISIKILWIGCHFTEYRDLLIVMLVSSCWVSSCWVSSCWVSSCWVSLCCVSLQWVSLCCVSLCCVSLCCVSLCCVSLCCVSLCWLSLCGMSLHLTWGWEILFSSQYRLYVSSHIRYFQCSGKKLLWNGLAKKSEKTLSICI